MRSNIIIQEIGPTEQNSTRKAKIQKEQTSFSDKKSRFFAWGKVTNRYSETMSVDVMSESGIIHRNVAVASREWAGSNSIGGFGERDLPPENTLVLIIFPYGNDEHGLVLCSAFTLNQSIHYNAWKSAGFIEATGKETEKKTIDEAGNTEILNKVTGDKTINITGGGIYTINVNGASIVVATDGAINIIPATGKKVTVNNGATPANDYPNCIFSGAPHCIDPLQSVLIP